ncbi:MAG: AAA family ATPase [Termitinemataceae bacterium]|nr:MAG: AAA family ATPase [Termitinemataceae bacterium]
MKNETKVESHDVETLESEVGKFVSKLPYWSKYLGAKILSGLTIHDDDISKSYSYLLEELDILEKTDKEEIAIKYGDTKPLTYKSDLTLSNIENVVGVNALAENQIIEFNPQVTIIYGENGSGKSGYVRLLKQVFYSKAPEEILGNIRLASVATTKSINAKFTFRANAEDVSVLTYTEKNNECFSQFAVFDGKGLFKQLAEKNEFIYRPAGLSFFALFADAINKVEQKLTMEQQSKKSGNTLADLIDLFEGESDIKECLKTISSSTNIEEIKKYIPFSEQDGIAKNDINKKYDELLLMTKNKEKEIEMLKKISELLNENKSLVEKINQKFSVEDIKELNTETKKFLECDQIAKNEGVQNFKTLNLKEIGSVEWKNFIIASENFAKKQETIDNYPNDGDVCLFCHQPLSSEARILINQYWMYLKSVAEDNLNNAIKLIEARKQSYKTLNFDIFPQDSILASWLLEKHPNELIALKKQLLNLSTISDNIITKLETRTLYEPSSYFNIDINIYSIIENNIQASISAITYNEQMKELDKLYKQKIYLCHKEKIGTIFDKFETFINNQKWLNKSHRANFSKRTITEAEKNLSSKYFNQKYIDAFNKECKELNGDFGIDISHSGSSGKSYRQLQIKGKNPGSILSEGEQKVIALSDFLAEMHMSEINRGIIFDDPVTSLDDKRKKQIAKRLIHYAAVKQVIIFTHDLVFVSNLLVLCEDKQISYSCHWIENSNNNPGLIYLNNTPSYEKKYRNATPANEYYSKCMKDDCTPMEREEYLKQGFAALRTCYEVLVINDLFANVVQRYNERVSIDSLSNVKFTEDLKNELCDCFGQCCRYMEGHSHSDKFAYQKPESKNLHEEIQRYETIKKKIKDAKK